MGPLSQDSCICRDNWEAREDFRLPQQRGQAALTPITPFI